MDTRRFLRLSEKPTVLDKPRICKIIETEDETSTIKTLMFNDNYTSSSSPGQFVMIWIPGIDEVPMSVSYIDSRRCGVTVKKVGEATTKLHGMARGDHIGVRGPYGRGFELKDGAALLVGGGTGLAPLMAVADKLLQLPQRVDLVAGAKSAKDIPFLNRMDGFPRGRLNLHLATEDGSLGVRGLASDLALRILKKDESQSVYVCGPELMMFRIFQETERLGSHIQASLERYMKCGVGLCGQCALDPRGSLVCRDGPVFSGTELRKMGDFGRFKREADGHKISIV
jgi:dihydroorotate dehydrogenase electron transfer subunit